MSYKTGFSYV
jgi:dual specificity tyrosine-phosphorylation-regulated kinase 2/3/4